MYLLSIEQGYILTKRRTEGLKDGESDVMLSTSKVLHHSTVLSIRTNRLSGGSK